MEGGRCEEPILPAALGPEGPGTPPTSSPLAPAAPLDGGPGKPHLRPRPLWGLLKPRPRTGNMIHVCQIQHRRRQGDTTVRKHSHQNAFRANDAQMQALPLRHRRGGFSHLRSRMQICDGARPPGASPVTGPAQPVWQLHHLCVPRPLVGGRQGSERLRALNPTHQAPGARGPLRESAHPAFTRKEPPAPSPRAPVPPALQGRQRQPVTHTGALFPGATPRCATRGVPSLHPGQRPLDPEPQPRARWGSEGCPRTWMCKGPGGFHMSDTNVTPGGCPCFSPQHGSSRSHTLTPSWACTPAHALEHTFTRGAHLPAPAWLRTGTTLRMPAGGPGPGL